MKLGWSAACRFALVLVLAQVSRGFAAVQGSGQITGLWQGRLDAKVLKYRLFIQISEGPDGLAAKIFVPDFSVAHPPADKISFSGQDLHFEVSRRDLVFDGKLGPTGQELTGILTQAGTPFPLVLKRAGKLPRGRKIEREENFVEGESGESVASYHPLATSIGYQILHAGGNAFDAFVAATFAEYVLSPGVTTPAGPLSALIYDAKSKMVKHLDATCNEPRDPQGRFDPKDPKAGASVLVPGAVKGLEALSMRYGRLPFAQALQPAIDLAENGFPFDLRYVGTALWVKGTLEHSEYGKKTFLDNKVGTYTGGLIRLPVMAAFLKRLAKEGSAYFYQGDWAKECVEAVGKQGGRLSLEDLSSYQEKWLDPWKVSYRGEDLYASAGRTYGGLLSLEALQVLENADIAKDGKPYSGSPEKLELMVRVFQESKAALRPTEDNGFFKSMDDPDFKAGFLSSATTKAIRRKVKEKEALPPDKAAGTHSYNIVIVDKEGNAITGTHTISSMPWGDGIFVQGIPLNAEGKLGFEATRPGERALTALAAVIALKKGKLHFALGTFDSSLLEAAFQFLVNLTDYQLSAKDALSYPRFGALTWNGKGLGLDKRVDHKIAETLAQRGIQFTQEGYIDTGLGSAVLVHDDGTVEGAIAPRN
jgi:gamma-glutamyltranspeptidase/glutathione hydrolase